MNPDNRTKRRKLGDIGENIACHFLEKRGFEIMDRNYLRKWGEIDIVAKKSNIIHFIEVKSVSVQGIALDNEVTHGTGGDYRPEDNIHPWKLKRLSRAMQTYLLEKGLDCEWQLDVITVKIDQSNRKARVEILENVII